jgi:TPR repeat protein
LGRLYLAGKGTAKNPGRAREFFTRGASLGDPAAQLHLGTMVLHTAISPAVPDYAKAFQLFTASAAQGNRVAAFRLAIMYLRGRGTAPDRSKALYNLRKSAGRGYAPAQRLLGRAFELGNGVPVNLVNSYVWYSVASEQGDTPSENFLSTLKTKMTASQIQQAEAVTAQWNTKIDSGR